MPIERVAVGEKLYLWTQNKTGPRTKPLVISAHGVGSPINGMSALPAGLILHFYGPHGVSLADPGVSDIMVGSLNEYELVPATKSQDYILSKYKSNPNENYDYFARLDEGIAEVHERALNDKDADTVKGKLWIAGTSAVHMDVLTIRKRGWSMGTRLSWVIRELVKAGYQYEDIHCNFCRGLFGYAEPARAY